VEAEMPTESWILVDCFTNIPATWRNSFQLNPSRTKSSTNALCKVHWQTSNKYVNKNVQFDATICRHLFTAKSLYMFRESEHPSSAALKTVTATSGIGHTVKYKFKIKN